MKSITYINKKDKDKAVKVKTAAYLNKIKLDSVDEKEAASLPDDAEILIMRGFTRGDITTFLTDLKKKGLRIDLKCVETDTNKSWPLIKLYKEIKNEHEAMQNMQTD